MADEEAKKSISATLIEFFSQVLIANFAFWTVRRANEYKVFPWLVLRQRITLAVPPNKLNIDLSLQLPHRFFETIFVPVE